VTAAAEWPRRRAEILKYWHAVMGEWPPLLGAPKFELLREERRESFAQRRVRVETAPAQSQEGWLLVPDGNGPFPAVLVVYYEPETSTGLNEDEQHRFRDYGLQLTRRGFVTLSIGTPGGNAWKPETGQATCQPLSFHAYVAANCWQALAGLPMVDSKRIGIVGHSYGGKWALFAAALFEKFACVAISDPGIVWDETRPNVNYWEPWYLGLDPAHPRPKAGVPSDANPRTGAYARLVKDGRDLTDLHALISPRPFLVSGGSEDPPERWVALNHAIAVNELLGVKNRVAMTNRAAHSPDEKSNAVVWAFFEHALGGK
jgi:dienelactone hydrolase